jgi:hypothetical protein
MKKIVFIALLLFCIDGFGQSFEQKNDSIRMIINTLNFEKITGITIIKWDLELDNGELFIYKSFYEKNKKGILNLIKKDISVFEVSKINKIDIITNNSRNEIIFNLKTNEYPYCFENMDKKEIFKILNNKKIPRDRLILHCENPIRVEFKNYEIDFINNLLKIIK